MPSAVSASTLSPSQSLGQWIGRSVTFPLSRSELWAIVREYLDQSGAKCIFSTAYFDEAADADLTLILIGGKIIAQEHAAKITAALRDRTFRIGGEDYQSLAHRLSAPVRGNLAQESGVVGARTEKPFSASVL